MDVASLLSVSMLVCFRLHVFQFLLVTKMWLSKQLLAAGRHWHLWFHCWKCL